MGMVYKVLCNDGTKDEGNPSYAPCVNNGGIKSFLSTSTQPVSVTPVLCKDGTTKSQINNPNAKVLDACRDNGGRAEVKKVNPIDLINSTAGIAKYKVNKPTKIFKKNPNKKDMFGDVGTDIIGSLNVGDVVEVAELGGGGRGIVMTPYLIFNDGSYIIGYDADKVDNSTPLTTNGFLQKNTTKEPIYYILVTAGAIVLGYFAYKKFKM